MRHVRAELQKVSSGSQDWRCMRLHADAWDEVRRESNNPYHPREKDSTYPNRSRDASIRREPMDLREMESSGQILLR